MASELTMAMADLDEQRVQELVKAGLAAGVSPNALLDECREGMTLIGQRFETGEYFLSDLIMAGEIFKGAAADLAAQGGTSGPTRGKVVMGTVKGDIHDIGKNLVAMMLEGAGFEVIDLGINTDADKFLAALDEHQPDILGMSALLTTTMPYMKVVIDTLQERGLRDKYIVLVGGAPLNEEFGQAIGADAYCRDAAVASETAKQLVSARRGRTEPPGPSV